MKLPREASIMVEGSCVATVVVCTYNNAASLLQTLESLADLSMSVPWELVVVDNNSTDSTRDCIESFLSRGRVRGKYAFEACQGLSNARNAGMAVARGHIVAFTDDDVKVSPDWLLTLVKELEASPATGMLCGRTMPIREGVYPMGVKTSLTREIHRDPKAAQSIGVGNNMAVRRGVAAEVGPFDPLLGAGTRSGSAEDVDYFFRVLQAGYCMEYTPDAVVYHDHNRVSQPQIRRIQHNYRRGTGAFLVKHCLRLNVDAWKLLVWEHAALFKGLRGDGASRSWSLFCLAGTWRGMLVRLIQEARCVIGRA